MRVRRRWSPVLLLAALAACTTESGQPAVQVGAFAAVDEGRAGIAIRHENRTLLRLLGAERRTFTPEVAMLFGFFEHEAAGGTRVALDIVARDGALDVVENGTRVGGLRLGATTAGQLRLSLDLEAGVAADSVAVHLACAPEDRFWGFGEQYNFVDLRGRVVPVWVQEQGVGRAANGSPPIGQLTDSYFPMPYTFDPAQGRGLLLEGSAYSEFDLCASDAERVTVTTWSDEWRAIVLSGPTPAALVTQLTAEVGRPKSVPPSWALQGVWLAAQGGTDAVTERVQTALAAEIPVAAVWVQDWLGLRDFGSENFGVKYRWTQDEGLYPNLQTTIAELRAQDVRFLGYFNPFVVPDYEQYATAAAAGYLIEDAAGDPYEVLLVGFPGSMLDLTNPQAVQYFQGFAQTAVDLGMVGWMADFGEWLPFDAVLHEGDAATFHNRYATEWHRINRQVLERNYKRDDFVMLTRSGYTGEHEVAQIVWAGDQEADWSDEDGLPTVVTAGLTLGLAGIPYFTHDIAGFSGGPSDKELFMRWTELGAFSPVMRTHDGLKKLENWTFDRDAETLAHFATFARIHEALAGFWDEAAAVARDTGLPIVRHTVLVDPHWPPALEAHGQWLLGEDFLVAPVVRPGADTVEVRFPEGTWEHLWTGERVDGRQIRTVAAPLGAPAVYVRADTWQLLAAAAREIWQQGQ